MAEHNAHSEYPTEAQIREMWDAYRLSGREGILAYLRKRTLEWQETERLVLRNQLDAAKA